MVQNVTLPNTGQLLAEPTTPPSMLLHTSLTSALISLGADAAALIAYDSATNDISWLSATDNHNGTLSRTIREVFAPDDFLRLHQVDPLRKIAERGRSLVEADPRKVSMLASSSKCVKVFNATGAQSVTILALRHESDTLGLLLMCWQRPPAPVSPQAARLMPVLAQQLALAIHHARGVRGIVRRFVQTRTTRRFLERIISIAGYGMLMLDNDGRIAFASDYVSTLSGFVRRELYNRPIGDLLQSPHGDYDAEVVRMDRMGKISFEKHLVCKDGSRPPVMVSYLDSPAQDNSQVSRIVLLSDLTDLKEREVALLRRTQHLTTIQHATQAISTTLDIETIPRIVLNKVVQVIGAEAGSILMLDDDTRDLSFLAAVGPGAADLIGVSVPAGHGIAGWIAETGESALVLDTTDDPRFYTEIDDQTGMTTRSIIAVPLKLKRRIIGVLEVINKFSGQFDEEDLSLLESLAQWAAVTIDNARLHSGMQARAADLERANAELQAANQLQSEMIQNISHELRTPLMHIMSYLEMLVGGYFGDLDDNQREGLEIALRKAGTLKRLIADIVTLQRMTPETLDCDWLHLDELAGEIVLSTSLFAAEHNCALELGRIDTVTPVYADGHRIEQVFDNLLSNAIKFSPDGGTITVNVINHPDKVQVDVCDEGVGIPSDKIDKVFNRFYQVDGTTTRRFSGLGLGLAIVQEIITAHRGEIWVENNETGGATFSFTVPKRRHLTTSDHSTVSLPDF